MTDQTISYKFKYSNYDLKRYTDERRSIAKAKREEAANLITEATMIENEAWELEKNLLPVEVVDAEA